jgi:penicillin-binding protein 1A
VGLLTEVPLPNAAPEAQSSFVYGADGQQIGSFHGEQNRTIVPLASISKSLKDAVVATEDQGFYTHPGVSLTGIIRAAFSNLKEGQISQGASTITQQYARIFSGTEIGKERTIARKIREATLAVKIERKYSKEKILEFYLNTVYFGRGAYGAEAAAQTYFKKRASELELAEAAYLAGVIRAPHRFQVETNPAAVTSIRNEVLNDMVRANFLDEATAQQAGLVDLTTRFNFAPNPQQGSPEGGYFIEYVRRLLLSDEFKLTEKQLLGGGLKIYTTLDPRMQKAAEAAVASTMDRPDDPEVALVAMDPQGHVRAMVGGRVVDDPKRARGFNFAANLPGEDGGRQAGSAFKPFALAGFVDDGKSVHSRFNGPSHIQLDSKTCRNADGTPWKVSNFENASYGGLDMVEATTRSVNTIYAQVMEQVVSPQKFMTMAEKAGISIPAHDQGCALTLGTSDVTPLEMARAYATFAARGRRPEPLVVTRILSPDDNVLAERRPRTEQTIDQNVADTVSWVLKQNINGGTGTGAKLPWPAMGKTGTAQNHADASFVGSTPEMTTAVWMGFPPHPQTHEIPQMLKVHGRKVTGGSFPATIWKKFMAEALKGMKHSDFPTPKLGGEVMNPPTPECVEAPAGMNGLDGEDGLDSTTETGAPICEPEPTESPPALDFGCEFPFTCPDEEDEDGLDNERQQPCGFPFPPCDNQREQRQQRQRTREDPAPKPPSDDEDQSSNNQNSCNEFPFICPGQSPGQGSGNLIPQGDEDEE